MASRRMRIITISAGIMMSRDVAIVAYQVHAIADTQIGYKWPFIELFKPKLFLPAHHDAAPPAWLISASNRSSTKYADMPNTAFLAPALALIGFANVKVAP